MTITETTPAVVATTGELANWHAATGFPAVCTPTGLVLPEDLSFDEWAAFGAPVLGAARASLWWVGDWIVAGKARWGSTYVTAIELTGLSASTLKNAVSVCRRVDRSRRRDDLPFHHHVEVVNSVEVEAEWDGWFEAAARGGWSVQELRSRIREGRALPAGSSEPAPPTRLSRFAIAEAHAPAALSLLSRCDRALRPSLSPDEVVVLDELLEVLAAAASKAAA